MRLMQSPQRCANISVLQDTIDARVQCGHLLHSNRCQHIVNALLLSCCPSQAFTCNNAAKLGSAGMGQLEALLAKRVATGARKGGRPLVTSRPAMASPSLSKSDMSSFASPSMSQTKRAQPPTASPPGTVTSKAARTAATPTPNSSAAAAAAAGGSAGGASRVSPTSILETPPAALAHYATRTNAGQRVVDYNPGKVGRRGAVEPSTARAGLRCAVAPLREVGAVERYRFMFTPLEERSRLLEAGLQHLQNDIVAAHSLGELTPVGIPCQEEVTVAGRVVCEAGEGRINKTSAYIEGSRRDSGGARAALSLQELPAFALFPGQIIAAKGINSGGGRLVVKELYSGAPKPLATSTAAELLRLQHSSEGAGGKPLSIMCAAGPYSVSGDLEYAPLNDLLAIARTTKPDVVLLVGPFVDDAHPLVAAGAAGLTGPDGTVEPVDFETLFRIRVCEKLELLLEDVDLTTQFLLVPSLRDAFHDYAFPQAPFTDRIPGGVELGVGEYAEDRVYTLGIPHSPKVVCLPNPAMFRLNEVLFGVTSADVLFDLSSNEASAGGGGNRLARLADHLLLQQSFYPVQPAPAASAAQLEPRQQARWRMPLTPDVLLLPGKLTTFARDVRGCLCINPGHLARGTSGGTFAQITIHPLPKEELEAAETAAAIVTTAATDGTSTVAASTSTAELPHRVAERTLVEVLRI
jgi:DNA polymerase alpha subunit B